MPARLFDRQRFRPLMVSVAWMCVAAQLLALGHLAIVEHERCPEHGELVHSGGHGSGAADSAMHVVVAAVESSSALPAGARGASANHDHCTVVSERRHRSEHPLIEAGSSPAKLALAVHEASLPGRLLYRLAPKISPPLLA